MTVLVREDLNDADLAWAVGDSSMAGVMAQALRARAALVAESPIGQREPERPCPPSAIAVRIKP